MNQPLAVIGMACRFPGGINSPEDFWRALVEERDMTGEIPADRWEKRAWFHSDPARPGKSYATRGGFRGGLDLFDAAFFGISPREASRMDPQQRLLLEMAWEALEDAGQPPAALAGTDTAVIVGLSSVDYQNVQLLDPESVNAYCNSGCSASIAANRISYFFDLRGPSFVLDTACSSSLVALHQACEAIWNGRSGLALAGGVNVLLSPYPWVGFSKAAMLSRAGLCRTFDADADGYVRSEGGAVVLIKPLERALADGDPIRAIITASATASAGRTHGLFLPNAASQETLLKEVYGRAGIDPARVAYVEAHGTGTAAGDPVECEALATVLCAGRTAPLRIGSVKTNVGHLEAASGMAGLLKVILALEHREIPANLHFRTPNPHIPFAEWKLDVVASRTCLTDAPEPLVMGVNSFGFGGANAHVVLQEHRAPSELPAAATTSPLPLFLSAATPEALRASVERHAGFLTDSSAPGLYDVCYTAAVRRAHHGCRLAVWGRTAEEIAQQLTNSAAGEKILAGEVRPAFVFSGNGSQWPGMGREMMRDSAVFRSAVERFNDSFAKVAGWSLYDALLAADEATLRRTEIAQPLLLAVQVGLVETLASLGLRPRAVTGHSVGEVAAAWAAGVYSLEQAAQVVYARGMAQAHTAGRGKMAACGLSAEQAASELARYGGALEVACINSPRSVTISGEAQVLAAFGAEMERRGVFSRVLGLDYPFHCRMMDDVRDPLAQRLAGLAPNTARLTLVSTTLGGPVGGAELDATHWWRNVRQPVRFDLAVEALVREGCTLFVEIGPHPVLGAYVRECLQGLNSTGRYVETLRREEPGMRHALTAVSQCYMSGCELDMGALLPKRGKVVRLPSYPWQRERHWNGGAFGAPRPPRGPFEHELLGYRSASVEPLWENQIKASEPAYLSDHRLRGVAVFPMAALIEMALTAARLSRKTVAVELEDLEVRTPLALPPGERAQIQFALSPEDGAFHIHWRRGSEAGWTPGALGRVGAGAFVAPKAHCLDAWRGHLVDRTEAAAFYEQFTKTGLDYGPAFRLVEEVWSGPGEALGRLADRAGLAQEGYAFHPAALDACLQVTGAALRHGDEDSDDLYVATAIRRMRLYAEGSRASFCHVRISGRTADSALCEVHICDEAGLAVAELEGFRIRRMGSGASGTHALPLLEMETVLAPMCDADWEPPAPPDPAEFERAVRERMDRLSANETEDPHALRVWADQVCGLLAEGRREAAVEQWRRGLAEFPGHLAEAAQIMQCAAPPAEIERAALAAVRAAAAEFLARWPEDRVLRVREMDGDAGLLAPHIQPLLPAGRSSYSHSSETGFDLVLSAGALHGRSGALDELLRLGRRGSLAVIVEQQPQPFFDVVLGPAAAGLLDRNGWLERMRQSGFESVTAIGDPPDALAGCNVFLAWYAGAAEQKQPAAPPAPAAGGCCLLVESGLTGDLAARLRTRGERVIRLGVGDTASCRQLLGDLANEGWPCNRVIHACWESDGNLVSAVNHQVLSTIALAQNLAGAGLPVLPHLWVLTRHAMPVGTAARDVDPVQGAVWGLGRVLAHEIPGLRVRLVDLHWEHDRAALLDRLMAELAAEGDEDEVVLTERARYVHRIRQGTFGGALRKERVPAPEAPFRLAMHKRGSPDNLFLEPCERPDPGPNEVEILIHAVGLNFRDVMLASSVLPEEAFEGGFAGAALGLECAGEIVRVGKEVKSLRPGDRVAAFARQSFSAFVVTDAALAMLLPRGVSCSAAASLLVASATAVYALEFLARVQPGERVLIHGAAGGVGLAALQLVRHLGAEAFATAGSEEKRRFLRLMGVRNVFSSRTPDYGEEILQATGGEGVDVVLNCLSGDLAARGFSVLRPFGRFLELGKRDFAEQRRMAMAPFRNNLSYFGIDLDQLLGRHSDTHAKILSRVRALIAEDVLRPLPYREFPVSHIREAFRHMQRSQHIGKVVISFHGECSVVGRNEDSPRLRADATYLIGGGLRGLGLETARWMARNGARNLALVSRSGPADPEAAAAVAELRTGGCEVLAEAVDLADEAALGRFLARVSRLMPPLGGVIHAAMTLDDALAANLNPERFWRCADPKIRGAWNLHRQTLDCKLDFFVMYSSVSTLLGVPGQASYAAANAFMESLAHHRRALGLPATAIAWGAISDTGYLARHPQVRELLESRTGVRPFPSRQAFHYLNGILNVNRAQWIPAEIDWRVLAASMPALARSPRFDSVLGDLANTAANGTQISLATLATLPADQACIAVAGLLGAELARVLGGDPSRIDAERPLADLGLDSLMAVELLTAVETRFGVAINPMEIVGGATLTALARRIVSGLHAVGR